MSIFGFSHIVSEVNNFELVIEKLLKNNYKIEYKLRQEVQEIKYEILDGKPKNVELFYLRNQTYPYIGIELIKHSISSKKIKNKLILAYSHCTEEKQINFDGNKIIFCKNIEGDIPQHIIIPVSNLKKSVTYYKKNFGFENYNFKFDFLYKEININYSRNLALYLPKTIFKSWNSVLHLLEIKDDKNQIFLNNIGFSCLCFLIKKNSFKNLIYQNKIVGPLDGSKNVKGKNKNFTYAFMQDPDGFLNEFYIV